MLLSLSACNQSTTSNQHEQKEAAMPATDQIEITSVFAQGQRIPQQYCCDGEDSSPPVSWSEGPEGTKCYALILDDPDAPAGTWVHWIAWNITKHSLEENESQEAIADAHDHFKQGRNSWKKPGYGGPCPPKPTGEHRYFFRIYALDTKLNLPETATRDDLDHAMEGHILAVGELMGTYSQ